ncbi:hypothetical protein [Thermoflexibacter ruber]|uniref:Uncharacterized protein n=1 Tax=Thermoflexibacter ruber TaxID=1003 RepID=A0A1I2K0E8_9BACT|nr:hypothetical protein [Thermoflexibacter ruber]SFF60615.1 hypothetical protein SAMN04488541_10793 [Thermoflexibacter ruber]
MLTLDNFEETINREILNRGRQYFLSQSVVHLEEIADNHWQAEVDKLIDEGNAFAQKGKFAEAMLIGQLVVSELIEVIGDSDDSSGSLGGTIDGAIELLADIGASEEVSFSLKVQLFDFLEKEAMKKSYYDYGDFGHGLLDVAQDVAMQIGETARFIKLTDRIPPLFSGFSFDFYKEELLVRKIAILEKLGQTEEIQHLINANMDLVSLRKQTVQQAIDKKDYAKAKQLIQEGIQIAESKKHPGTVAGWEKELLAIAVLEKDLATVHFYTKKFAFERGNLDVNYYRQWKGTFSEKEWEEELQKIIIGVYKEAEANENNKRNIWFNAKDFTFDKLAPIFIEEQMWDRLLELTKHTASFNTLHRVHEHLVKRYPKEVLDMYMPIPRKKSIDLNGRREYQDFTRLLQRLKKDIPDGKQEIDNLVTELKVKYAKRPAMIEELNNIK